MVRLIDADALYEELRYMPYDNILEGTIGHERPLRAIVNAPTVEMPGWISVNERLPEDGQFVVVRHEVKGRIYSEVAHYIMDLWWLDWDTNGLELNAICWMPLPEPPEEVNKNG